jgi:hypothetical protein
LLSCSLRQFCSIITPLPPSKSPLLLHLCCSTRRICFKSLPPSKSYVLRLWTTASLLPASRPPAANDLVVSTPHNTPPPPPSLTATPKKSKAAPKAKKAASKGETSQSFRPYSFHYVYDAFFTFLTLSFKLVPVN